MNNGIKKQKPQHSTPNTQRSTYRNIFWLTALLSFVMANTTVSQARVFWRWNASENSDHAIESLGGNIAYSAPIKLNGGNGTITVYSFKEDLNAVTKNLRRTFDAPGLRAGNGSMAATTVTNNSMVINLIAISMQEYGPTTLFKFVQTTAEAKRSKELPKNPIKEISSYPNAITTFYAKDIKTKTALAVSTAQTSVQAALEFYLTQLSADGWAAPLSSLRNPNPTGNMLIYQKKNQLCCILASTKPNRETSITVLHKELNIE